jgi:hypothetical protein
MTDEQKNRNRQIIREYALQLNDKHGTHALAEGYLRYQLVRRLPLFKLAELFNRNLHGENYDDLVDEMIVENLRKDNAQSPVFYDQLLDAIDRSGSKP